MCGLVGALSHSPSKFLDNAIRSLKHRGPDAQGKFVSKLSDKYISLGHTRLSIIDLDSNSNQPYSQENLSLVFNGEIYNHNSLRSSKDFSTFTFKTKSDTEVILAGYKIFGNLIFPKLNGMFSIVIFDKFNKKLILARDPFGIKPLYYSFNKKNEFFFASEIKALSIISDESFAPESKDIAEFLLNGFLYEPKTGLIGVNKVKPGELIEIDLASMQITKNIYYNPLDCKISSPEPFSFRLDEEVNLQSEADVPVGIFFSGGLDSSALALSSEKKLETFFVEYSPPLVDSKYARNIAKDLNLNLSVVEHSDLMKSKTQILEEFYDVAQGTEEPISNYTYISTRILSKYARNAGFKVMLSGMGGDEIFGGYPRHFASRYWSIAQKHKFIVSMASKFMNFNKKWHKKSSRFRSFVEAENFAMAYTNLVGYFSQEEVERLLDDKSGVERYLNFIDNLLGPVKDKSFLRQAMYLDRSGYLSQNLTYTDKASMAESIEIRVPFLSASIESYVNAIEDSDLMDRRGGKLPLRKYCEKHLPRNYINRPKVGFNPPLDQKINFLGFDFIKDIFLGGNLKNYINIDIVFTWLNEHFSRSHNHTYRLWQMIYLNLWLESYKK
ncbi:asparagine synthase (glutamine-hydrolyzing) [Candidatus Methylopumilus universalis]|uniref:asparagine synthase (glutamine-hydrolyzing) n=1 Tax=Candidatus Methylopumilus universalis TaxID=2588536 RepID=A0AAX1F0H0_9PROT|nr:asparagine synthase (glutamine-hydrolyzing) [Candidatus Methylopumilus universalis]QDC41234.1 asparagine synthase (glutamine-hydrolyzing) [Candidatus Methylopumilus universalis]QDC42524.1 asparagine synthase (glutamine-hydrolyzing) [Candidatus Methylopumilus universalis]QDC54910.1 asparagine synthase (glutamine-hydrolyzing) [Candidatus Methylopumilus universalis]QDC56191.1 asparagine synthase (glutamine-hydrolyzing) [Candidatus Methylopumilus universalis]QDC57473.1 asparagine synthase (glut